MGVLQRVCRKLKSKIYILDVDFTKDIGGAGKASKDIIFGLANFYEVIFIPKYAETRNIKNNETREAFSNFANFLLNFGIPIPSLMIKYVMANSDITLRGYIQILTTVVEEGALVLDLNYFPFLSPFNLQDLFKEFFFFGEIYYLKKYKKCRISALLQTLDNRPIYSHFAFALRCLFKFHYFNLHFLFKSLYSDVKDVFIIPKFMKFSDKILLYSSGSLVSLKVKLQDKKFQILKIGNTIEKQSTILDKKNYILYFARLIPEKGIFDILYIFREILPHYDIKLVVAGKFKDDGLKGAFFHNAARYGLSKSISYLGYVSRQELDLLIKNAKVFLYPSHYDSFPYAILESLVVHTAVVAYSIPTPKYAFDKLECVKFVREFDFEAMAKEAVKFLMIDKSEYASLFQDKNVREFIRMHENSQDSAEEIANHIKI